jgi:hypothetical protein
MKILLNNWLEIRLPTRIIDPFGLNNNNNIRNQQTLLIKNRKKLKEIFMNTNDVNPLIKIFLDNITPLKNFKDISFEFKLPLEFIKIISKQITFMNLGYICNKFNNNTILTVNPNLKFKTSIDLEIEKEFKIDNVYLFVNKFVDLKPLNKIFKKNLNYFTNENFLK